MPLAIEMPVESRSLSERAYEILKDQIIHGHLAPGEKLDIHELAKKLRISRTPVKEAINRLTLQGLVTIKSRKTTFVSVWESNKVSELFDLRLMMELWAAERALKPPVTLDLQAMGELLKEAGSLFQKAQEFDYTTFTRFDQQFHLLIVDGGKNSQLRQAYDSLNAHIQIMRVYWGRAREHALRSHKEHLKVFEAFKEKSPGHVRSALSTHIINTRDNTLKILPSMFASGVNREPTESHSER